MGPKEYKFAKISKPENKAQTESHDCLCYYSKQHKIHFFRDEKDLDYSPVILT